MRNASRIIEDTAKRFDLTDYGVFVVYMLYIKDSEPAKTANWLHEKYLAEGSVTNDMVDFLIEVMRKRNPLKIQHLIAAMKSAQKGGK